MRKYMGRIIVVAILALTLQGCSFLVNLAVFNNSERSVEICNLNLEIPTCQNIAPGTMVKVLLVGDRPDPKWNFSIRTEGHTSTYSFKFGPYPEHASDIYCRGTFQKQCDIPVQYEASGLLYWGGKSNTLPVGKFPNQPEGFPVEPSA